MRMIVTNEKIEFDDEEPQFYVENNDFPMVVSDPNLRKQIAIALKTSAYSIGPINVQNSMVICKHTDYGFSNHVERLGFYAKNR